MSLFRSIVLLLLCMPVYLPAQEAPRDSDRTAYLRRNTTALSIEMENSRQSIPLLDSAAHQYRMFFAGESHDHIGINEVKWRLLQYFYYNAGVRMLVLEEPAAECWLLTRAMQQGNKKKYNEIATYLSNTVDDELFYRNLYAFNQSLPPVDRIRVFGADLEQDKDYLDDAFDTIFSKPGCPAAVLEAFAQKPARADSLAGWARTVIAAVTNDEAFKKTDPDRWYMLRILLRDYTVSYTLWGKDASPDELNPREAVMYANVLDLLDQFPGANCFCQFGSFHICLQKEANWYDEGPWSPIASRLNHNDESPVKGKVCNLDYLFTDQWYGSERLPDREKLDQLRQYRLGDFTLVRFDGAGTPYGDLTDKLKYGILVDYDAGDQRRFFRQPSNDPFAQAEDIDRAYIGITAGVSAGKQITGSVGAAYMTKVLNRRQMPLTTGLDFEWDVQQRLHGYHYYNLIGFEKPVDLGFGLVYNTDYFYGGAYFRPQLGFAWNGLQLNYAYNVRLYDPHLRDAINTHMIRLLYFLPVYRLN